MSYDKIWLSLKIDLGAGDIAEAALLPSWAWGLSNSEPVC